MSRRTRGREVALQVLYQIDLNPAVDPAQTERFMQRRLSDAKLIAFARSLVEGVRAHQAEIDERISAVAENWRIDRMAVTDRTILRLGAFEILYLASDVPRKVAINEALELAKRYSTAQSSRFVNGILDRIGPEGSEPTTPLPEPGPEA
jgi:N utilization substance protein B